MERYEVLVSPDERTCDDCGEYDGQQFLLSEMVVGVNAPPFHPNCRDCIVPVI
ncbi:MAG: minor capsid protein [Firmicutes bacterium]|nr:minor capsid protein [Candidatus Caballimonas caccae]